MKKLILTSPSKYIFILLFFAVSLLESVPTILETERIPVIDLEDIHEISGVFINDISYSDGNCYVPIPNAETNGSGYGKVFVYSWNGNNWYLNFTIVGQNLEDNEYFGTALAFSNDYVYISSYYVENGNIIGSVHQYSGTHFVSKLQPGNQTGQNDFFGKGIAVTEDCKNDEWLVVSRRGTAEIWVYDTYEENWAWRDNLTDDYHYTDNVAISKIYSVAGSADGRTDIYVGTTGLNMSDVKMRHYTYNLNDREYYIDTGYGMYITELGLSNGVGTTLIMDDLYMYVGSRYSSEIPDSLAKGKLHRYRMNDIENPQEHLVNYENDWPNMNIGKYSQQVTTWTSPENESGWQIDKEYIASSNTNTEENKIAFYENEVLKCYMPYSGKKFAMGFGRTAYNDYRLAIMSLDYDDVNQNYGLTIFYPRSITPSNSIPENDLTPLEIPEENVEVQFTEDHSELELTASMINDNPPNPDPLPTGITVLIQGRYWQVSATVPYGGTVGTYDITFDLTGLDYSPINFTDIKFLKRENTGSPWQNVQADLGATIIYNEPYITIQGLTSFSEFVPATTEDAPLPVVLSSFNAIQTQTNFAQINWTTQSETNLNGYNIYRSEESDINSSLKLNSSILEAGNNTTENSYSYTDEDVEFEQSYFYWIESVELDGNTELFGPTSLTIESPYVEEAPNVTVLNSAYPNPFNPSTTISYQIKNSGKVELNIYNIKGQKIKTLVNDTVNKGKHSIIWNGVDESGKSVNSGVYFYKLQTPTYKKISKMLMLK